MGLLQNPRGRAFLGVLALVALGYSGYALWKHMGTYTESTPMSTLVCAKCKAESDIPKKDVPTTPLDPKTGKYTCPKCGAGACDLATFKCPKCSRAIASEALRGTAFECPYCKTPFDSSGGTE